MAAKMIAVAKDGSCMSGVNIIKRADIRGKVLMNYVEIPKTAGRISQGSVVFLEESAVKFVDKFVGFRDDGPCVRMKNLEFAFSHFVDCLDADARSYSMDTYRRVAGKPFYDDNIYFDGYSILEAYSKVFASMSEDKQTVKAIKSKLKDMRIFEENLLGVEWGVSEYRNIQSYVMQKFGKKKSEVSDFVHSKTVEYLMHSGAEVFGLAKASLKANNQCQNVQ